MQTYAAIDLHSNNGVPTVIDENDRGQSIGVRSEV
jgi:hypothetical protein